MNVLVRSNSVWSTSACCPAVTERHGYSAGTAAPDRPPPPSQHGFLACPLLSGYAKCTAHPIPLPTPLLTSCPFEPWHVCYCISVCVDIPPPPRPPSRSSDPTESRSCASTSCTHPLALHLHGSWCSCLIPHCGQLLGIVLPVSPLWALSSDRLTVPELSWVPGIG